MKRTVQRIQEIRNRVMMRMINQWIAMLIQTSAHLAQSIAMQNQISARMVQSIATQNQISARMVR